MAKSVDDIAVSSNDNEILACAEQYGAKGFMRPEDISGDYAQSERAVEDVLTKCGWRPDIICILQCTSPIRRPRQIDAAIELVQSGKFDSVLSGVWAHKFIWRDDPGNAYPLNYDFRSRPMRQARPREFFENGSIYVFLTDVLEKYGSRLGDRRGIYEMPYWSQFEIDQADDLDICEWIMGREDLW